MALGLLSGCHWHRKAQPPRAAAVPRALLIGTIALIDENEKFALIDHGANPTPPVGSVLKCYRGDAESGELITTDVRKHPFTIADLQTGQPRKGDRVMLPPPVAKPIVPPPVAPAGS